MKNAKLKIITFTATTLLFCLDAFGNASSSQPNFIVFILDDWGAGDASVYGHTVLRTPNIDQVAKSGITFNSAFLTTSSCSASRASILSGLYPNSTGAPNLHDSVPDSTVLLSSILRNSGYYTAAVGKWHMGDTAIKQFDRVTDNGSSSGTTEWLTILKNRPKNAPFFFWFAAKDPHLPYEEITPHSAYQPEDITEVTPFMVDGPLSRRTIAQYYNEISRTDQYIGDIVKELLFQQIADNTYIFIMSDNGAPFPREKTTLYDRGIKTPFIAQGPLIKKRQTSNLLISSIDLFPTILDLSSIAIPETIHGRSFKAILMGDRTPVRDFIYAEQFNHGYTINKRAIRTDRYLYIQNLQQEGIHCLLEAQDMAKELYQKHREGLLNRTQSFCFNPKWEKEEFYDAQTDAEQIVNLINSASHKTQANSLRKLMEDQQKLFIKNAAEVTTTLK